MPTYYQDPYQIYNLVKGKYLKGFYLMDMFKIRFLSRSLKIRINKSDLLRLEMPTFPTNPCYQDPYLIHNLVKCKYLKGFYLLNLLKIRYSSRSLEMYISKKELLRREMPTFHTNPCYQDPYQIHNLIKGKYRISSYTVVPRPTLSMCSQKTQLSSKQHRSRVCFMQ